MRHLPSMMCLVAPMLGSGALTACSAPAPAPQRSDTAPTPSAAHSSPAPAAASLVGHWTGVEGMVLDVAQGDAPGRFRLAMQWDLDHRGTFAGEAVETAMGPGIAFTRAGRHLVLRPSDGEATGLKYLANKRDCLTVASGEGYCRD